MKVHLFDEVALQYTTRVSPYRYPQFLALLHELRFTGKEKVLDIGCGPGPLSMEIASRIPKGHLWGIDLSDNMIKLARELADRLNVKNVSFQSGDGLSLDFENDSFDAVISSNAFPWVADQKQFLKETHRVLKPNGKLGLISLANNVYREFIRAFWRVSRRHRTLLPYGSDTLKVMRFKRYSVERLNREVTRAGFNVRRAFQLSTEEPITPRRYLNRVNAIVNENYLEGLSEPDKKIIRNQLYHALARKNGDLKITESSVFIIAAKL